MQWHEPSNPGGYRRRIQSSKPAWLQSEFNASLVSKTLSQNLKKKEQAETIKKVCLEKVCLLAWMEEDQGPTSSTTGMKTI